MNITNSRRKLINPWSLSLIMSFASLLFAFFFTGLYFGWVDDLFIDQALKGQLLTPPLANLSMHLSGISYALKYLYIGFPKVHWFGVFGVITSFLILLNYYLLVYRITSSKFNTWEQVILSLLGFFIFIYQAIYLFNLSSSGLLLMGLSLSNFFLELDNRSAPGKRMWLFLFCFFFGSFFRFPMVTLSGVFLAAYLWLYRDSLCQRQILPFFLASIVFLSIPFLNYKLTYDSKFRTQNIDIVRILDSQLHQQDIQKIKDSVLFAKAYALYYWFLGDPEIREESTLNEISKAQELKSNFLIPAQKLRFELNKSLNLFGDAYCEELNWFWRSIGLFTLSVTLLFFHLLYRSQSKKELWKTHFITALITYAMLLYITISYKMEERVFWPIMVTLLFFQIFLVFRDNIPRPGKVVKVIIFSAMSIAAILRLTGYHSVASQKSDEIDKKRVLMTELEKLKNFKLIFVDLYSSTLFHDKLLHPYMLPQNATYLAYKELFGYVSEPHEKQLIDICGTSSFIDFYKCLYDQRESVGFLYFAGRVNMLENYFLNVYDETVTFKPIHTIEVLDDIKYSYIWESLEFNFYTFDYSFQDAVPEINN